MTMNPYDSPTTPGESPESMVGRWLPRLVEVLVVIGIIVVLIALLLPAVRRGSGSAARRSMCGNHLKQIGLALHNYQAVHGSLPPAYTVDAEGQPLHSWRTLILPFMAHEALYDTSDLSTPWDDPANKAALETVVHVYHCPAADGPATHTTYLAVVAPGGCFRATEPRAFSEITDDHNLTLMVVEADAGQAVHWMSPTDASEREILNLATSSNLPHPGGAQAVLVSGATYSMSAEADPAQLRALISIAAGDDAIARGPN